MGYNNQNAEHITGGAATVLPCFFDVETCAIADAAEYDFEPIEAPSNWKDPVKIAAYLTEKRQERTDRAALDPDLCRVVCLVMACGDGLPLTITARDEREEAQLLSQWALRASDSGPLIGFNCSSFDLPVLIRRCQYLGIDPPRLDLHKYHSADVIDLMQVLSFNGTIKAHSQVFYLRRFGINTGDTIKGSEIPALVGAGEWDKVESHCRADVEGLRQLAARLNIWPERAMEAC